MAIPLQARYHVITLHFVLSHLPKRSAICTSLQATARDSILAIVGASSVSSQVSVLCTRDRMSGRGTLVTSSLPMQEYIWMQFRCLGVC